MPGIVAPGPANTLSVNEMQWLTKINRTGNTANFLPLLVAARKHRENGDVSDADYIGLLKALECFAYRVFLYNGRRSNAGKSKFYRWAYEVFTRQRKSLRGLISEVQELTRGYAPEESFTESTRHRATGTRCGVC